MTSRLVLATAVLVAAAACGDDGPGAGEASDPAAVIEGYVAAYNAHDIDRVMTFFADDAVVVEIDERTGGEDRLEGATAIRAVELDSFSVHAPGGQAYTISNVVVVGDTVTWDHLFDGVAHTCVGIGNEAEVESGKIVRWFFPSISCD